MAKPWIPVSRLRPWFGQPTTTGIPRRAGNGLGVSYRTTRRFIAGAVVTLGIIPEVSIASSGIYHLHVSSVRNDRGDGKVINFGLPPSARIQTPTISHLGLNVVQVRNDRRDGKVLSFRHSSYFKVEPHIFVHRKPLTPVSRLRPWFGSMPPVDIPQNLARKFGAFNVYQRFDNRQRSGRVIVTGPKLTGESIIIIPNINRRISISAYRRPQIEGKVYRFAAPRATFALNVERIPNFKVVSNRSSYQSRQPKGSIVRFFPKNDTITGFGSLVIYRGSEIWVPGQHNIWEPRRVDFIPSEEQRVPKVLKIFRRQVLPYNGKVIKFGPRRETPLIVSVGSIKSFKIYAPRYTSYTLFTGRVFRISPRRINPTPASSLNHGLIRLSNFKISLSVKRENDGGKADVFAADASGTVINFNKAFKIVESITVTSLNTALQTPVYDFNHATQNPTNFKVKLFDNTGSRVDGTVSWKARGIL